MQDWLLKYWLQVLFAAVTGGISWAVKKLWHNQKEQNHRQQAIEDGLKALLHDRIYQCYVDCEQKGFASIRDIENMDCLYLPYHALGGNGAGTELFDRMKKMPVDPEERGNI